MLVQLVFVRRIAELVLIVELMAPVMRDMPVIVIVYVIVMQVIVG